MAARVQNVILIIGDCTQIETVKLLDYKTIYYKLVNYISSVNFDFPPVRILQPKGNKNLLKFGA